MMLPSYVQKLQSLQEHGWPLLTKARRFGLLGLRASQWTHRPLQRAELVLEHPPFVITRANVCSDLSTKMHAKAGHDEIACHSSSKQNARTHLLL